MSTKINQLLQHWPSNTVATQALLSEHGIDRRTARKYVLSNWLERIGDGAYRRPGQSVNWAGAVHALQTQLRLQVHPGGISALDVLGYAHYVAMGQRTIFLFGAPGTRLPTWFRKNDWGAPVQLVTTRAFSFDISLFTNRTINSVSLELPCLELAALEMLYQVPQHQSYEEAYLVMEGLTTLRPSTVQNLLERTQSIKTKRLFMHVAERLQLPWIQHIDIANVDFGGGKRTIHKGGQLNTKYQLVVNDNEMY